MKIRQPTYSNDILSRSITALRWFHTWACGICCHKQRLSKLTSVLKAKRAASKQLDSGSSASLAPKSVHEAAPGDLIPAVRQSSFMVQHANPPAVIAKATVPSLPNRQDPSTFYVMLLIMLHGNATLGFVLDTACLVAILCNMQYGSPLRLYGADAYAEMWSYSVQGHATVNQKLKRLFCLSGQ